MGEHKGEELKGRAKEAIGDLKGDKDLQREGKADQMSAKTKDTISDTIDKAKGGVRDDR